MALIPMRTFKCSFPSVISVGLEFGPWNAWVAQRLSMPLAQGMIPESQD